MSPGLLRRLERQDPTAREPAPVVETAPPVAAAGRAPSTRETQPDQPERPRTVGEIIRHVQNRVLSGHAELLAASRHSGEERQRLKAVIARILVEENLVVRRLTRDALSEQLVSEIVGYGPIDQYIRDPAVTEVMVNGPGRVYVERKGRLERVEAGFRDHDHLHDLITRVVAPLGRRLDQASPFVDARLPDGSRVNAVIAPLSLVGPVLTVRKFPERAMTLEDLVGLGALNQEMAGFLEAAVRARLNVIISGGAGAGKTTLLNALAGAIPGPCERIITIEDSAELKLPQEHVVSLESRPANTEGRGEVTIRQLLRNALRMRPDRLIIGECRGGEAFELLQAMNSGHNGSFSTVHANSATDALARVENMVLMAGEELPHRAIIDQIRSAADLVVHVERYADGGRRLSQIGLVDKEAGPDVSRDRVGLWAVFRFNVTGVTGEGSVDGCFEACPAVAPGWLSAKFRAAGEPMPPPLANETDRRGARAG